MTTQFIYIYIYIYSFLSFSHMNYSELITQYIEIWSFLVISIVLSLNSHEKEKKKNYDLLANMV